MSALYSWGLGRPRLCLLLDHFCGKSSYYPHSDPKHRGGHSSSANAAWNLGALLSMMVLPEGWTPSRGMDAFPESLGHQPPGRTDGTEFGWRCWVEFGWNVQVWSLSSLPYHPGKVISSLIMCKARIP